MNEGHREAKNVNLAEVASVKIQKNWQKVSYLIVHIQYFIIEVSFQINGEFNECISVPG